MAGINFIDAPHVWPAEQWSHDFGDVGGHRLCAPIASDYAAHYSTLSKVNRTLIQRGECMGEWRRTGGEGYVQALAFPKTSGNRHMNGRIEYNAECLHNPY